MGIQINKPQSKFKRPQVNLPKLKFKLPRFSKKKMIVIGLVIVFIGGYALKTKLTPLKVQGIVVSPAPFTQVLKEEGLVNPVQEAQIYSKVSGQVTKVHVENGDQVKAGDVLYEMDTADLKYQLVTLQGQLLSLEGQERQANSPPLNAQVLQQRLIIEQAKNDLEDQEENVLRMEQLLTEGFISKVEYDGAVGEWERAKHTLAIQRKALDLIYEQSRPSQGTKEILKGQRQALASQIDNINQKIQASTVRAPIDGMVKDLTLKEGVFLQQGQLILALFEQGQFEVSLDALAEDALRIKEGTPATISIVGNQNEVYKGQVTKIAPAAIEKPSPLGLIESRVPVTLVLNEEAPLLLPGYKVKVEFIVHEEANALVIPTSAFFSAGDGDTVWVMQEGKAEIRSVTKGLEDHGVTVIIQGLAEGDIVIADPYTEGLSPGKRVEKVD